MVYVRVLDENDNIPTFLDLPYIVSVQENDTDVVGELHYLITVRIQVILCFTF